ncbi:MAG: biotin/lipoyl-containing protein [Ktedonobacterales bacterium]
MSSEILVPELGESIVEATVGSWLKRPGETVTIGDPLVELETEKVNMEIAAAATGVLVSILKEEGETVAIGDVLGIIGEQGIDLVRITAGSGLRGQITHQDVATYVNGINSITSNTPPALPAVPEAPRSESIASPPSGRPEERLRLSRRRQTIARRLVEAQHSAAMLPTFNEVDMSQVLVTTAS